MLNNDQLANAFVDNKDFNVFVIKDILSREDINEIKHHYMRFEHYYQAVGYAGQRKWGLNYKSISDKLQNIVSKSLNEQVETTELELCIYTPDFGYKPKLYPHYDHHVTDGQRVTMSIQIDSNIDWDIIVENKKYKCNKNEGLVFSGTQQIHWRDNIEFKKGDYSVSIFAHFKYKNNKPHSPNQKQIMDYWEGRYQEESGIPLDPIPLENSFLFWSLKEDWIKTAKEIFP